MKLNTFISQQGISKIYFQSHIRIYIFSDIFHYVCEHTPRHFPLLTKLYHIISEIVLNIELNCNKLEHCSSIRCIINDYVNDTNTQQMCGNLNYLEKYEIQKFHAGAAYIGRMI